MTTDENNNWHALMQALADLRDGKEDAYDAATNVAADYRDAFLQSEEEVASASDVLALKDAMSPLVALTPEMRDRALRAARALLLPRQPSFGEKYADTLKELLPGILGALYPQPAPAEVVGQAYGGIEGVPVGHYAPPKPETAPWDDLKGTQSEGQLFKDAEGAYWYRPNGSATTVRIPDYAIDQINYLLQIVGP